MDQQLKGEESLADQWTSALRDGMRRAGCAEYDLPGANQVQNVFYGDVFRRAGRMLAVGNPGLTAADATDYDRELLAAWWRGAADSDPLVVHPDARTLARTPVGVQAALRALSCSAFFAGLADRAILSDLQQVRRYMTEPQVRQEALGRIAAAVGKDTRVVVGHSLGSVVAYEALCAHPEWPVRTLVTLGSPLGIRSLIFDKLVPAPAVVASGRVQGAWPGEVRSWANVADAGDVVALVKDLRPLFGEQVANYLVHNGSHAHDARPYLTAAETGAAIAAGLLAPQPGTGRHAYTAGRDQNVIRYQPAEEDLTEADVPHSDGLRVRGNSPKSTPGQAAPESTPAKTSPGGPVTPSVPAEPVALPVPEHRFLQGRFPERVRLGEDVSLLVRLGLRPGGRLEAALRPLSVPEAGLEVVLLLVDSPGFALRSPERMPVRVIPRQDSDWASFELQAAQEGVHTLQVEAFAGGTGLGGLPIQVSVDAGMRTGPLTERSSPAMVAAADPGEISLLLSYDDDQHVYRYRLVDSGGYYSEEAASDRLLQPPGQAIEQLVAQLNALARGQEAWDAATTRDWLKGQGITLWNSFIPQALQREFWQRQDRITQMTIISQGDPVPWELLYPFAPGGRDAGFLVDQFPVARRRYGPRPPGRLELGAADLVLSQDASLAAAPAEIAALDGLLRDLGLTARRIDDLPGLLQAFRRGDLGLLHFSCHNAFTRGAPNAPRILLRDQPFEPVFLEEHAGRFASPLVFLNACRTDGQAPLYTTVEGWASSFLRAGAGAFVGSLWEVSDISASIYAQAFYQAALSGHALGESARRARDAIRDNPGDPTWLAYTLYGDPAATISTRAARPA